MHTPLSPREMTSFHERWLGIHCWNMQWLARLYPQYPRSPNSYIQNFPLNFLFISKFKVFIIKPETETRVHIETLLLTVVCFDGCFLKINSACYVFIDCLCEKKWLWSECANSLWRINWEIVKDRGSQVTFMILPCPSEHKAFVQRLPSVVKSIHDVLTTLGRPEFACSLRWYTTFSSLVCQSIFLFNS